MKNKTQTVRKIVGFLNNSGEEGGFWLLNIHRPFVWSEDQICRLFGSIFPEELFFDMLSGDLAAPDHVQYRFKFVESDKVAFHG
jgi:hypothetical protein